MSNSLKRKYQENHEITSKLLHNQFKNDKETPTYKDCTLIKRNMYYAKKSIQPSIPISLSDIDKTLNNFKIKKFYVRYL